MSNLRDVVARAQAAAASPAGKRGIIAGKHAIAIAVESVLTVAVLTVIALVVMIVLGPIELLSFIAFPIYSVLVAALTLAVVLVLGLPLRLMSPLRRWWIGNGEVALIGAVVGAVLIIGSFAWGGPIQLTDPDSGVPFEQFVPHGWTFLAGWLLLAFSLAHVWWPRRWTRASVAVWKRIKPTRRDAPATGS